MTTATLARRPAPAPVLTPRTSLAAEMGIRIGRVVVKKNLLPGGSDENKITLSGGLMPSGTQWRESCLDQ